jgi:hypothetical protein
MPLRNGHDRSRVTGPIADQHPNSPVVTCTAAVDALFTARSCMQVLVRHLTRSRLRRLHHAPRSGPVSPPLARSYHYPLGTAVPMDVHASDTFVKWAAPRPR